MIHYEYAAISRANRQGRPGKNQDALLVDHSTYQGEVDLVGQIDVNSKFLLAIADGVSSSQTPDVAVVSPDVV